MGTAPNGDLSPLVTNICLLVQSVYDSDPRVRRKAEALAAAGYGVDVLSLCPPDGRKIYTLHGVNVRAIALGKKRGSLARYLFEYAAFFLWAFVRVPLQMRRRHYAVVDVNTLPDFLVFAPALARLMGAKIVLDMHEITPEFYMSKYGMARSSWVVRLLTYLEKISFDFADHVITINEPIQDLLAARGLRRSRSTVIMNAADEARFQQGAASAPGTAIAGRFAMIYHGTLTPIYGLDVAIEAFAIAHGQMPEAEMWILGSGTEERALSALAARRGLTSRIKLIGQVPASDIPGWLSRADVGILPIRRDVFLDFAFPNKLPEFIVAGKPVLISRLNAIRHYFSEDSLAFFEPNDASDLATQMLRLYQDRPLRQRLVANARREYEPIRWDLMRQRYLGVVSQVGSEIRSVNEHRHETAVGTIGDEKRTSL
jgi:glycosyltransferase involved in cell wall biosynthesis